MVTRRQFLQMGVCGAPALACSFIPRREIWAKHPKSSSPLFRVVVEGRAGYIDGSGKIVIQPRFSPVHYKFGDGDFFDGLAYVTSEKRIHFVDEKGDDWPFPDLPVGERFSEGLTASSKYTGQTQIVDLRGRVVATVPSSAILEFSEGLAAFVAKGNINFADLKNHSFWRGYLDKTGRVVIPPSFAYAGPFSGGLAVVALDGKCWVEERSPFGRYPAPSAPFNWTSCGPQVADSVESPCRHGYIDRTGKMVIFPGFELARPFAEERAAVRINGKWGFIDRAANMVIEPQFDETGQFGQSLAAVRIGARWGYVDRAGRLAIPARYTSALSFSHDGLL